MSQTTTQGPPKSKWKRPPKHGLPARLHKPKSVDSPVDSDKKPYTIEQIKRFQSGGLTLEEIGKYYGVSKQAIHKKIEAFEKYLVDREVLDAYRNFRVDLYDSAEAKFLSEMVDDDTIKNASLRDLTIAFGTTFDKRRLHLGESTANVALHALVEEIERSSRSKPLPGTSPPETDGSPQDVVSAGGEHGE